MVKIAVAVYSTYGHILTLAKAEAEGVKAGGAQVDVFQLPSGEPNDASAGSNLPLSTPSKLAEYDGVSFGIPSRFGTHPYAFKAFFDATGAQWAQGAFFGKYAGFFVTSGTQGGGQESVIRNSVTILAHHGMLYVPLGYGRAFGELTSLTEVHGGSPWGAGSFAGPSGARQPSELELNTARIQGKSFAEIVIQGNGQGNGPTVPETAAAGAGAAGAGAAGAAGTTAGTANGALASDPSAVAGKSVSDANTATSTSAPDATNTAGSNGAAGAGVAGATATSGAAGAGGATTSGAPTAPGATTADNAASKATEGVDGAKGDATNAAGNSKSDAENVQKNAADAPTKAEAAKDGAANKAQESAEKESNGCCKCM